MRTTRSSSNGPTIPRVSTWIRPWPAEIRVEFIEEFANSDVLVIGSHFSDPTGGFIVRDESGCRLAQQPAAEK